MKNSMTINNKYRILEKIIAQECSHVYHGLDLESSEERLLFFPNREKSILQEKDLADIRKQINELSKIRHPDLVRILSLEHWENQPFLVTEYPRGIPLKFLISKISCRSAIRIVFQAASILDSIHREEILYSCLTPSHIFIFGENQENAELMAPIRFPKTETQDEAILPCTYFSPENTEFLDRPIDERSDLYQLGLIFYELLTGSFPFSGKTQGEMIQQHLGLRPDPPSKFNRKIPVEIDAIVLKLLEKEPAQRFPNAQELLNSLAPFAKKTPSPLTANYSRTDEKEDLNIPMIGRSEPWNRLLKEAQKKEKTVSAYIVAESGMGKSKLVQSFQKHLSSQNLPFYRFECSENSIQTPLSPFIAYLNSLFLQDSAKKHPSKLLSIIKKHGSKLTALLPGISDFFPFASSAENNTKVPIKQLFPIIQEILEICFEMQNLHTFILENLQWLDPDSFTLFLELTEKSDYPLFFLLTETRDRMNRNRFQEKIRQNEKISIIPIKPLSQNSLFRFIQKILKTEQTFDPVFYEKTEEHTLGNPAKIQELLHLLCYEKILTRESEKWFLDMPRFSKRIGKNPICKSIPPRGKLGKFLQAASVMGENFSLTILKELLQITEKSENISDFSLYLQESLEQNILEENILSPGQYRFTHKIIREHFYYSISTGNRTSLHGQCAGILEDYFSRKNDDATLFQLAHHYIHSTHHEKKNYYCRQAYESSLAHSDFEKARFYLKIILDSKMKSGSFSREVIQDILSYVILLQRVGEADNTFYYIDFCLDVTVKNHWMKETLELIIQKGTALYTLNRIPEAIAVYHQALDFANKNHLEVKDPFLYSILGSVYFFTYDLQKAVAFFNKASSYDNRVSPENTIRIHGIRSWAQSLTGNREKACADIKEIEAMLKTLDNPIYISEIYHYCSVYYSVIGNDYQKAYQYSLLAFQYAGEADFKPLIYSSLLSQTLALIRTGRIDDALYIIQKAVEMSQAQKITLGIDLFYAHKAIALFWKKAWDESYQIAKDWLKKPETQKLSRLLFLEMEIIYLFHENHWEQCLAKIQEGYQIEKESSILLNHVFLLELERMIYKNQGRIDKSFQIQETLNIFLEKYPAFEFLREEIREMIRFIEQTRGTRKQKNRDFAVSQKNKEKYQLEYLLNAFQDSRKENQKGDILSNLLEKALELTGAERGLFLAYREPAGWKILSSIRFQEENFLPLLEPELYKLLTQKTGFIPASVGNLHSRVLIPIVENAQVKGALYLDSKLIQNLFNQKDIEMLSLLIFKSQFSFSTMAAQIDGNSKNASLEQLCADFGITPRELEIIRMAVKGYSNKKISQKIFVTPDTVKKHLQNIYKKVGINNRVELVNLVLNNQ
jgi:DNA-binding CsgD family transcriptional regulator/serine/threonine protein kinase